MSMKIKQITIDFIQFFDLLKTFVRVFLKINKKKKREGN